MSVNQTSGKPKIKRNVFPMKDAMDILDVCLKDKKNLQRPVTMFKTRVTLNSGDCNGSILVLVTVFSTPVDGLAVLYRSDGEFLDFLNDMPAGVIVVSLGDVPATKQNAEDIHHRVSKCIVTTFIAMLSWKRVDYVIDYMLHNLDELLVMVRWNLALQVQLVSIVPFRTLRGGFVSAVDLSIQYKHVPFVFYTLESSTVNRKIFDEAADLDLEVLKVSREIFEIMNKVKIALPRNVWFVDPMVRGFHYFVEKELPTRFVSNKSLDELIKLVNCSECSVADAVKEASKWYPCRAHFGTCPRFKKCIDRMEWRLERIFDRAIEQNKTKKPVTASTRFDFEAPYYRAHIKMMTSLEDNCADPKATFLDG